MKALSIRQPWASLIIQGYKPIENRSSKSNFRGPLLIHAGLTFDCDGADWVSNTFPHLQRTVSESKEFRGGIIGSVLMVACVTEHPSFWFFGKYGYLFMKPRPLEFSPYKGQLGFFDVPCSNNQKR